MHGYDIKTSAYSDSFSLKWHHRCWIVIVLSSVAPNDSRTVTIVEGCRFVIVHEGRSGLVLCEFLVHEPTAIAKSYMANKHQYADDIVRSEGSTPIPL